MSEDLISGNITRKIFNEKNDLIEKLKNQIMLTQSTQKISDFKNAKKILSIIERQHTGENHALSREFLQLEKALNNSGILKGWKISGAVRKILAQLNLMKSK